MIFHHAGSLICTACFACIAIFFTPAMVLGETLGEYYTAEEEAKYYRIVEIPMPTGTVRRVALK